MPRPVIYSNAVVFTGRARDPLAEAFAVDRGRFLAVGDRAAVERTAGPDSEVVDLGGSFVSPGFFEAHTHIAQLGQALDKVQLRDCDTLQEIQDRLLAARDAHPSATVLLGVGWRFDALPEDRPTAAMIDAVVADIPVLLDANDLHSTWANSAALAAMGITRDTTDPVGGEIVRDTEGDATGFLLETAAMQYGWGYLDRVASDGDRDRFLDNAFRVYLETGVTGATEMALDQAELDALVRWVRRNGRLPFPVTAHWLLRASGDTATDLAQVARAVEVRDELAALPGLTNLRLSGVKLVLDGVIDACTAAMRGPYANGAHPDPIWSLEAARRVVIAADAAGLQLALHAIGDRASEIALDLVEACARTNGPRPDRAARIEHLESVGDDTIARMAALGVIASMQPVHCDPAIMDNWMAVLGDDRAETGFPWHRFRESGVRLALGTDAPTAPHEAPHNLFIALTAKSVLTPGLPPYHPERVFSPADALEAMALGGAAATRLDGETGRIAPGFRANFVVLDENPLRDAPERLLAGPTVQSTFVDGEERYRAG